VLVRWEVMDEIWIHLKVRFGLNVTLWVCMDMQTDRHGVGFANEACMGFGEYGMAWHDTLYTITLECTIFSSIPSASGTPQQLSFGHRSASLYHIQNGNRSKAKELNIPCLNSSGFSDITQCPQSTSASLNLGKNSPIAGKLSSGTYLLCVPLTNSAGPLNRTSPGFLNGKSPRFPSADPSMRRGIRNFFVRVSGGWYMFVRRNWRIGRDWRCVSFDSAIGRPGRDGEGRKRRAYTSS